MAVGISTWATSGSAGWSILDVTDPTAPEYVGFVPGPENTWTIQIQVAEGKMITAL